MKKVIIWVLVLVFIIFWAIQVNASFLWDVKKKNLSISKIIFYKKSYEEDINKKYLKNIKYR